MVKELAKKTKEEKKISQPVFVKNVKNFDWFGATESICMHCGKTGHKGTECKVERRECFNCGVVGHIAKDCPEPKKAKKAKEAASDKLSDSTIDQS